MELTNEFEVSVPVDEAWAVLTDLERIAPCLPGAQLDSVDGDDFHGTVKVKVGPITAQYQGKAHFVSLDPGTRRATLAASGRDTRGQGNASATITAELVDHGEHTHVSLLTDLALTGKVAQFGRGVLGDVSARLLDDFVANLEQTVLSAGAAEGVDAAEDDDVAERSAPSTGAGAVDAAEDADVAEGSAPPTPTTVTAADVPEVEPVDLLDTAGVPVLKRVAPVLVLGAVVLLVLRLVRRRRR